MSWTKRQLIDQAFESIGYASYVYDLQPEQLQTAMYRLDAMVATWNGRGIRLGYPLPSNPQNSDLDMPSEAPDYAAEAIYLNLAIRIAPTVGRTIPDALRMSARIAYNEMLARNVLPCELQFPETLSFGAGNKPWRFERPFFPIPNDPVLAGEDGPIEFD